MESMQSIVWDPTMMTGRLGAVVGYVRRLSARDPRGQTDRQLVGRFAQARDEAAFAELVRRHGPMVLATCRRVLRHEQDAEDAFQAVFLVLARKAGSIREADAVGGWLHQVAHRLAVRAGILSQRREERLARLRNVFAARDADSSEDAAPALVDEELQRLPEPYRAALVLCYLEGRTQTEAARLLATTPDAVNSRLKRARHLLRQRLSRRGWALSSAALSSLTLSAGAALAALPGAVVQQTARIAVRFVTQPATACGASALAIVLARGSTMFTPAAKVLSALALLVLLLTAGTLLLPPVLGDAAPVPLPGPAAQREAGIQPQPEAKAKPQRACIILWMSGGPSQIDTFDPKPNDPNGGLFGAIDTTVKGVQFSQLLPNLAKQAQHMAIIRSLTHREGDHNRGTYLMRTGYTSDGQTDYPALGCVLGKELEGRAELPRYVSIGAPAPPVMGYGAGFLGREHGPLVLRGRSGIGAAAGDTLPLPPVEEFEALAKGRGEAMRREVAKAMDLSEEQAAVRDAYGRDRFGQGCLLARRLLERGVPVVEVTSPGWDAHANSPAIMPRLCAELDAGWTALLKDLHVSRRLETTLIVWMGEFGRTPRINNSVGRDHWPFGFSAVLAGGLIKGGQAIGKTSADAMRIEERPVTPQELHATIYQALGIDPAKENRTPGGQAVPLVEKGTRAVKEALR